MIFMGLNASAGTQVYNAVRAGIDRARGITVTSINPNLTVTPINPNLTVTPLNGLGLDYGFTRGMLGEADSGIVSGLTVIGLLGIGALALAFMNHQPKRRRR